MLETHLNDSVLTVRKKAPCCSNTRLVLRSRRRRKLVYGVIVCLAQTMDLLDSLYRRLPGY